MSGDSSRTLPDSWTWVPLAQLGTWCGGGTPSKARPEYWTNGTVPWASPKDMKVERISTTEDCITEEAVASSATNLIEPGAVLLVTRSGILERTLPVAIADVRLTLNQDLKALQPHPGLNSSYLAAALRRFEQEILHTCTKSGTTVASIEFPKLLRFQLPLAPAAEQERIVSELDRQLTRLAAGVSALHNARTKLKRYRASVLKAACEGRLVPTEAELARKEALSYESAHSLLEKYALKSPDSSAKRKGRPWGSGSVPELTEGERAKLPEGWAYASLGQVAPLQPGYAFPSNSFKREGIRLLKGINVRDGWLSEEEIDFWAPGQAAPFDNMRLSEGDIVLAMDRPVYSSGSKAVKVAVVTKPWDGALLLQRVGRFRFIDSRLRPYIHLFLQSEAFRTHLILSQNGSQDGKDLPHVSASVVDSTHIPLPPLAEQERIVAEASRLITNIRGLELAIDSNLKRGARLRQAVLKQAFEGKLVPQDSQDEPAQRLLERIRQNQSQPVDSASQEPATGKVPPRRKKAS